jgi:hypothetical protein
MISFGVDERESWIATVDAGDARSALLDVERLPSGAHFISGKAEQRSLAAPEPTPRAAATARFAAGSCQ